MVMLQRTLAALAALSSFIGVSSGSPITTDTKSMSDIEARQSGFYAITGAAGGVQPRLELRQLEKNKEMWNLYLLAMAKFQAMNQNDKLSYYQIAGIHGQPWIAWDGVQGTQPGMGYCPHNQLLFATWHRPYLVLFEQVLQNIAIDLANGFPTATKAAYQAAAQKLRVPYWDWALNVGTGPVMPSSLTVEKVTVTFQNGTTGAMDNPLFDYDFHPLDNTQITGEGCRYPVGLENICKKANRTLRAPPTDGEGNPGASDNPTVEGRLKGILTQQRKNLYNVLSHYQPFNQFSNDGSLGSTFGTLEGVHNPIHLQFFFGHMAPPVVAAFDPIFWLHHANVDRQLAIWQAIYPTTYVEPYKADTATFTIAVDSALDASSPLTPFHKDTAGTFWTSTTSRNIETFKYTYPELAAKPSNATLIAQIKALYDDSTTTTGLVTKRAEEVSSAPRVYLAKVTLPVGGLEGAPYSALAFLGGLEKDGSNWVKEPNYTGTVSTLGGMKLPDGLTMTSSIDITEALKKRVRTGELKGADQETVVKFVKDNLQIRVVVGDTEVNKEEVKGEIKVELISTAVVDAEDGGFERWVGGFTEHGVIEG